MKIKKSRINEEQKKMSTMNTHTEREKNRTNIKGKIKG
jgi:hypothetical protein